MRWSFIRSALLLQFLSTGAFAADTPLPADVYLHPAYAQVQLSPDGKQIAFVRRDGDGVDQLWKKMPVETQLTHQRGGPIEGYRWLHDGFAFVRDGTLFTTKSPAALRARVSLLAGDDTRLLLLDHQDNGLDNVVRFDVKTRAFSEVAKNPGDVITWLADRKLNVRAALAFDKLGGRDLRVREGDAWRSLIKVDFGDTLAPAAFTADGKALYLYSSKGRGAAALVLRTLATNAETGVAALEKMDVLETLFSPKTGAPLLMRADTRELGAVPGMSHWIDAQAGLAEFQTLFPDWSQIDVVSGTDDLWLLAVSQPGKVRTFHLYTRAKNTAKFLFSEQPRLDGVAMPIRKGHAYAARDGLTIMMYVTEPRQMDKLLFVVLVRDTLEARDAYGSDPMASWLASRGFTVIQVNVRGSIGFGKKFFNAANKEWGLSIQDDLLDLVDNLRAQLPAALKIPFCIMGTGFGGHLALSAAFYTPHAFSCAVAIGAPSHLESWLASAPLYLRGYTKRRVGDPSDPDDVDILRAASPRLAAARLAVPLLLVHDSKDTEVPIEQSLLLRDALAQHQRPVEWLTFDDTHWPSMPKNEAVLVQRIETFLRAAAAEIPPH